MATDSDWATNMEACCAFVDFDADGQIHIYDDTAAAGASVREEGLMIKKRLEQTEEAFAKTRSEHERLKAALRDTEARMIGLAAQVDMLREMAQEGKDDGE